MAADLTTEQLCERLQISPHTAREWARKGVIKAYHLGGKHTPLRWPLVEVERYERRRLPAA